MNENDKNDLTDNNVSKSRLSRRRLLKTGAAMAPLALTIHGGIPLAHADSAGLCVRQLEELADLGDPRMQIPTKLNGQLHDSDDGESERYGQSDNDEEEKVPFNSEVESHWKYIKSDSSRHGYSCLNSINMYEHINNRSKS